MDLLQRPAAVRGEVPGEIDTLPLCSTECLGWAAVGCCTPGIDTLLAADMRAQVPAWMVAQQHVPGWAGQRVPFRLRKAGHAQLTTTQGPHSSKQPNRRCDKSSSIACRIFDYPPEAPTDSHQDLRQEAAALLHQMAGRRRHLRLGACRYHVLVPYQEADGSNDPYIKWQLRLMYWSYQRVKAQCDANPPCHLGEEG